MAIITSKRLLERLYEQASASPRPKGRLGTITRVVAACDAIESGDASNIIKDAMGTDYNLRYKPEINPSTVARYIEARQKKGGKEWTGPKRPTIQSDYELKSYVEAREFERKKPVDKQRKTSQREEILNAIDSIPRMGDRALIRGHLAELQSAKRENDFLSNILKKIAPLQFEQLRAGELSRQDETLRVISKVSNSLPENEVLTIKRLFDRLTNKDELSKFGLELGRGRVRHAGRRHVLIEQDELACLAMLSGGVGVPE